MNKLLALLVLVALAACVFAAPAKDQETAEQFYRVNGYYPSWYSYGSYGGYGAPFRSVGYPYGYAYGGAYPYGYGYSYGYGY